MLKAAVLLIITATLPLMAQDNKETQDWHEYTYPANVFAISAPRMKAQILEESDGAGILQTYSGEQALRIGINQ